MKTLLRPYEGTQPYIFVSYAHKNDAAVLEIIGTLQSRGFRVWYDEGIEAGSEWPESIASHLERAQLVLALLSPAYLRSDNCRKEMHYALTKKSRSSTSTSSRRSSPRAWRCRSETSLRS